MRALEPTLVIRPIDKRDVQARLQPNVLLDADPAKETKRFVIAAKDDVLAIVNRLSSGTILIRGRAATETRPGFEHQDVRASFSEVGRRA